MDLKRGVPLPEENVLTNNEFDDVRETAREVRSAFEEMPDEPFRRAKSVFPRMWCEWASIALAEALSARRLGEWTFIQNKLADALAGHAWIELRDVYGAARFTIDITLDQFEEWNQWHMGESATPAIARFTRPDYAGPWRRWPAVQCNDTYAIYAEKLVRYIDGGPERLKSL